MNEATYKGRPMGLNVHDQKANFPVVAKQELGLSEIAPSQLSSSGQKRHWRASARILERG